MPMSLYEQVRWTDSKHAQGQPSKLDLSWTLASKGQHVRKR